MKHRIVSLLLLLAMTFAASAQAATRPVSMTWTAPTTGGVTNYAIFKCNVPVGSLSCTPILTGTPIGVVTTTSFSTTETVGAAYGYSIVANYPACTLTSSLTAPCGASGSITVNFVPVPPQGGSATNVVIVEP